MSRDTIACIINNAEDILDDDYPKSKAVAADKKSSIISRFEVNSSRTKKVRGVLPTIVRKPSDFEYIRTYVDMEDLFGCHMMEIKENMSDLYYIVSQDIAEEVIDKIGNLVKFYYLQIAISNHGNTFVWPLKTHGLEDGSNGWNCSAWEAAKMARKEWIKVISHTKSGQYNIRKTYGDDLYPEPLWADGDYLGMLDKVFEGKMIDSIDHPILLKHIGTS